MNGKRRLHPVAAMDRRLADGAGRRIGEVGAVVGLAGSSSRSTRNPTGIHRVRIAGDEPSGSTASRKNGEKNGDR